MSGDGTRIAVGAEVADTDEFEFAGYVSVYEWNATAVGWQQMGANLFGPATLDRLAPRFPSPTTDRSSRRRRL